MLAQHRHRTRVPHYIAIAIVSALSANCATGSTLRSGVGDTFFDRAPYYAGQRVFAPGTVLHLPIQFHRADAAPYGPADVEGRPLMALLAEMNEYLDGLSSEARLVSAAALPGTPPDVQFGCEIMPGDECENADDRRPLRLAVGRPSRAWVEAARAEAQRSGAERVLLVGLEIGNYLPRQRNWRGDKEVQLGTGYSVAVPWLTALDRPASVLQITGALMDLDGRAVRIGAEGLVVRRTNVILSGFGIQALISDEDVERARTTRREDLPGQPLVWQVALSNLVAELTGRPVVEVR
jgi:hypothetical protein